MDSLNKNFIWLTEPSSAFAKELSGTFMTMLEGVPCLLELEVSHRVLCGSLSLDDEVFEIRGFCSRVTEAAYGVLFEPVSNTPIALLKITPLACGLRLELDMPDFEEIGKMYKPQTFTFRRRFVICHPKLGVTLLPFHP